MRVASIYKLEAPSGRVYIGQTWDPPHRRWRHYRDLRCKGQPKLYRALLKHGPETFQYSVLLELPEASQETVNALESFWISVYDATRTGLNCMSGGHAKGRHSDETKQRMSTAHKGHPGVVHTPEARARISASRRGRTMSEENRSALLLANVGRKPSPETTAKRVASLTGKVRSEEALANMRAGWLKRKARSAVQ